MTVASSARASSSSESFELQLRQARELALLGRVAHGEHDRHRLRQQPPRDESEDLGRGAVEPLRVVHDAQQRPLLRHLRQHGERGQRDQEAVGGIAGRETEGDAQRDLLRLGKRVEPLEHRSAELMQPREGQLHLGLDTRDPRNATAGRLASEYCSSAVLPTPGLAPDDQDRALTATQVLQQPPEQRALTGAAPKPWRPLGGHAPP